MQYRDRLLVRVFLLVPAQAHLAVFPGTGKELPLWQKAASFHLDQPWGLVIRSDRITKPTGCQTGLPVVYQ